MLRRLVPVAIAVGVAALTAGPALAATPNVPINSGNIKHGGTLATQADQKCDFGGGPFAGQDVWVFILPGNYDDGGDFTSVTAWFDSDGNGTADKTIHITGDGGGFANGGPSTSKAYIALPAGWRLLDAKADITGMASFFNLTHACAAGTSPMPSRSAGPTPTPTPSVSGSASASPSGSAGASESPGTSESPSTGPSGSSQSPSTPGAPGTPAPSHTGGGGLPTTGVALTSYAVTATLLIAAGIVAVLAARRRRFAETGEEA